MLLKRAVPHRPAENFVDRVTQRCIAGRQHADIMAHRDALRLDRKSRERATAALGENIVEQHGVQTTDHEIAVWMHIVIVRDRLKTKLAFGAEEDFISDRATEGADPPAPKVGEGAETRRVGVAHAQHFAKLVVGNGGGHGGAPRRRVFNPAQADLGVAPLDGLIDGSKGNVDEPGFAPEAARDEIGDLDVEADEFIRLGGVRFDKRRAAFRVTRPEEFTGAFRRPGAHGQRYQCREGSERSDFEQGSHMILSKNSWGLI